MKPPTLLFFLCLVISARVLGQFNDSTHYYIAFNGTGNINKTNGANAYLLNNGFKVSVREKKVTLNFNNGWLYGQQNAKLTNNDFSTSLDFNLNQKETGLYYWGLGNFLSSYSLKVVHQLQSGLGLAYTFYDNGRNHLNLSNGILFETSRIRLNDSTTEAYQTFRNSLRLNIKYSIGNTIVFEGLGFLQNSLQYKNDYIIKANSSLNFKINKWLSLNTTLKYNHLEKTNRENLLLSYGFKAESYF